jgi:two-component sensor histidine kinase
LNTKVEIGNKTVRDRARSNGVGLDLLQLSRFATERSPMPMFLVEGSTHRVVFANRAFSSFAGMDRETMMGRPFDDVFPKGSMADVSSLLDRVFISGMSETILDQEHAGNGPLSGYWSYTAWPVLDEKELPVGVMVQLTNTTEAVIVRLDTVAVNEALICSGIRQHEETETLNTRLQRAMKETHHRIKNNLQVIAALAETPIKQGVSTVPISALRRIAKHVQSLALLHDMLTQQGRYNPENNALDTKQILSQLLSAEQAANPRRRITANIESLRVPIQKMGSLCMLTNELVNNAVKHGTGDITVTFEAEGETARLSVCDQGKGFPAGFDPRRAGGVGMDLITSFTRYDLRGEVEFSNSPGGGACVTVILPLPECI